MRTGPLDELLERPGAFEFYQAVRLLELGLPEKNRVGGNALPENETVRFQPLLSLAFPRSGIRRLERADEEREAYRMVVTFMGLYGPSGVLPRHYTDLLIALQDEKKGGLRAFLDMVNHRFISLFYRAHAKYRPASGLRSDGTDPISRVLFDLMGMAEPPIRKRAGLLERGRLLRYCGLFTQKPRSLKALEAVLRDFLGGIPVHVEQFVGNWVRVTREDQGRLLRRPGKNRLGHNVIVGVRVRDVAGKFRVRLGPVDLRQYLDLQPETEAYGELCMLVREFVGDHLSFDVQLVLRSDEVPSLELRPSGWPPMRLGRTSWIRSAPSDRHGDEPVFPGAGLQPLTLLT